MEFLSTAWEFGKAVVTGNWITASLVVAPFVLPNALVRRAGRAVGWTMTTLLRQKAGKKQGEEVEAYFQGSLNALMQGINEGLDADDASDAE